jgi:hypothetical protein
LESNEHKKMGDLGSGGASMELAHNESHFSRPDMADGGATQQQLAGKPGANNAGSYRANHDQAIAAAVAPGERPRRRGRADRALRRHL